MDQDDQNKLFDEVDNETKIWQQGDYSLGELDFYFVANSAKHIVTNEQIKDEDVVINQSVLGLCVVTQTCDIVRTSRKRHFIEFSPIVRVKSSILDEVQKGKRPNYAFLKPLEKDSLVVDLDRTMTAEKSVLLKLERLSGLTTDEEKRRFSWSLGRKRTRCAFPDDFNSLFHNLSKRIQEKHKKNSPEGEFIRSLREIRVRAAPSWGYKGNVEVTLYLIKKDDAQVIASNQGEQKIITTWKGMVSGSNRYDPIIFELTNLEILTAKDYIESDLLDYEHLSQTNI